MTQEISNDGGAAILTDPGVQSTPAPDSGQAVQPEASAQSGTNDFISTEGIDKTDIPKDVMLSDIYLPDNLKNDESVKTLKTVTDLANRMIASEKMVGGDKLSVPGKDSTPEQWSEIYNKLGRPDDPSKYKLATSPDVPEGLIPKEIIDEYAKKAHDLGSNTKQANEMYAWYESVVLRASQAAEDSRAENLESAITALKKEYGNGLDQKVKLANSVFKHVSGGDAALEALKDSGLENNATVVKWLANIGEQLGEDRMLGLGHGAGSISKYNTPEQAKAKISEMMNHPGYRDEYHPEHKQLMTKLEQLMADASAMS